MRSGRTEIKDIRRTFTFDKKKLTKKQGQYFTNTGKKVSGQVVERFPGGSLKAKGTMLHGFKQDLWEYFYENGQLRYWCRYIQGKKDWFAECFDEHGALLETENWSEGVAHGPFKCFERGRLVMDGTKYYGEFDGPLLTWYPNGQPKEKLRFKKGVNHGLFRWWYENGQLEKSIRFVNGEIIGHWEEFYENGNRKYFSEFSTTGQRFGWTKEYAENGILLLEEYMVDSRRDRVSRSFYPSGHLKNEKEYRDGSKHGHERSYSERGQLIRHTHYDEGQILSDISFLPLTEKIRATRRHSPRTKTIQTKEDS